MQNLNELNNIADTVKIPTGATHYRMNPTNKFIEQFYKVKTDRVFCYSIFNQWNFSEESVKKSNFIENYLIPLKR